MKGARVLGCRGAQVLGCWGAWLLISLTPIALIAQDPHHARVMAAVRSALAPALPFPETDRTGAVPADGRSEPLWMVRPLEPGSLNIEVLANPLNDLNQIKAERAMAQIQNNVESAQRRAAAQYDRAVAEAKRTGRSQDVDGVTLNDEGIAGEKIDADSHVTIAVAFNQPSYHFNFESGASPQSSMLLRGIVSGAVDVVTLPSNTYREQPGDVERFREGETVVYLGRVAPPQVKKSGATTVYELTADATAPTVPGATSTLVLRFRGNEALIADLLRKTDWNALLELLK